MEAPRPRVVAVVIASVVPSVVVIPVTPARRRWRGVPILIGDKAQANDITEARQGGTGTVVSVGENWFRDEHNLFVRDEARVEAPRRDEVLTVVVVRDVTQVGFFNGRTRRAKDSLSHWDTPPMQRQPPHAH
jgi:hypothetical protein